MYWLALAAVSTATITDWRRREIPHWISVALILVAVCAKALGLHPIPWSELLLGAGVAFVLGAALFALGALGGGDVKLFAALGAALGLKAFVPFLLITSVAGGALALVARRRGEREQAYAPAMLLGLLGLLPLVYLAR